MHVTGLIHAQRRLELTKRAFASLSVIETAAEVQNNWFDFLVHWRGVIQSVGSASNDNVQNRQWFLDVKQEIKNDALLRYLNNARNHVEYGISSSIDISARETFRVTRDALGIHLVQLSDGTIRIVDNDGNEFSELTDSKLTVKLVDVTERDVSKIVCVPQQHQGKNIEYDVLNVARLGLLWVESLVNTAIHL